MKPWVTTITVNWINNSLTVSPTTIDLDRNRTIFWAPGTNVRSIDNISVPTGTDNAALEVWQDGSIWKCRDSTLALSTYTYTVTFTDNDGIQHVYDPQIVNNPST